MMHLFKKLIGITFLLVLTLSSCRKDVQNPTNLNIQVVDAYNNPIVNAMVTLYQSQYDYNNYTNQYATGYTDGNGNVAFNNINANVYYYSVYRNSDCSSNDFTSYYTSSLNAGVTNNYEVAVNEIGYINFYNNSTSNAFQIYINGVYYYTLSANSVLKNVPELLGNCNIQVQHIDGTDSQTFSELVTDCSTTPVSFQ